MRGVASVTLRLRAAGGLQAVRRGLATALSPRFSLRSAGQARTLRRTWLDTADWRLHRAGLTLEHRIVPGGGETVLADQQGVTLATQSGSARWPCRATDLPEGPLRAALAPVTGERAILETVRTVTRTLPLRVHNTESQAVAWLSVDKLTARPGEPASLPASGGARARSLLAGAEVSAGDGARGVGGTAVGRGTDRDVLITISPLRGRESDVQSLARSLSGPPLLATAAEPAMVVALAAVGRRPGDYTGRVEVSLAPEMPAGPAVAHVLLVLLDLLERNVPGTVRDLDTEFLHDLRVAVRRTRAALKLLGDVLPAGLADQFAPEFKWLGDATTPTRDLDVYLESYQAMAASLMAATPAELLPFRDYLGRRRSAEWHQLVRALRSARFTELTGSWRSELAAAAHGAAPAGQELTVWRLAADRTARAHRRVLAAGNVITDASPPEALHALRKRCKELRYVIEFFASLHDRSSVRAVLRELKGLQDCLGAFQDTQVQRLQLRVFAAQMVAGRQAPAHVLLAMGEVAAQLAARQREARAEFSGRFARFSGPQARTDMAALMARSGP